MLIGVNGPACRRQLLLQGEILTRKRSRGCLGIVGNFRTLTRSVRGVIAAYRAAKPGEGGPE